MHKLVLLVSFALISACGQKQFKRSTQAAADVGTEPSSSEPANTINETDSDLSPGAPGTPEAPLATDASALPADEKSALDQCLSKWTSPLPPFSAEQKAKPHVVNINEAKSNNQLIYQDTAATAEPKLFLINLNIDIGNQGEVVLKNPKGWYCLNVKSKVINNFTIHLATDTQYAIISKFAQNDNKFQIIRD